MKHFPKDPRTYVNYPGSRNRIRTFIVSREKIQQPKTIHMLDKMLEKSRMIEDFKGNERNFGEIIRHLESKGFDCSEARERFKLPAAENFGSILYAIRYQNGNNGQN